MSILRNVTFERASRRKDKSISLSFITSLEQSTDEFMELDTVLNDSGVLFFKSNGTLTKEEVKALETSEIEVEGKTKSQRLRNVIYILHQQSGLTNSFNDFYANKMEEIIQHFKDKLTD
jgi:hypothetical protein